MGLKNLVRKSARYYQNFEKKKFEIEKAKATVTFCEVSGTQYTDPVSYGYRISLWGIRGIPNRYRTFLFKYFNNLLGLNFRLSHFVANQQRGCTFCLLTNAVIIPDETFSHLFYECRTTRLWHEKFLREHVPADFFVNFYLVKQCSIQLLFSQ